MKLSKRKYWLYSIVLLTPLYCLYLGHYLEFLSLPDLIPTGFLSDRDSPYYMALAREYFDRGDFNLFYPLPFSDNFNNEAIYFQPHILFSGILWKISGLSPGTVWTIFGLLSALTCFYFLVRLFDEMYGLESWPKKISLVLLLWGGGLLAICGLFYQFIMTGGDLKQMILGMFVFDPDKGCLLYTSPSPRDATLSRMPSSA